MRYALLLVVALLAGAVGYLLHDAVSGPRYDIDAAALRVADQINRVSQYATAEGLYTRMYRYRDEGATSWLSLTDKQVMVRADARVLVGFAFDSVRVDVDRTARQLVVRGWPPPSELAFEFDTEYFDVREGLFSEIDADDLNAVRAIVRKKLRAEVDFEALYAESYAQAHGLLGVLSAELEASGWGLRVEGWPEGAYEAAAPSAQ